MAKNLVIFVSNCLLIMSLVIFTTFLLVPRLIPFFFKIIQIILKVKVIVERLDTIHTVNRFMAVIFLVSGNRGRQDSTLDS